MSTKTSPTAAAVPSPVPQVIPTSDTSPVSAHLGSPTGHPVHVSPPHPSHPARTREGREGSARRKSGPTVRETRGLRRAEDLIASGKVDKALDHLRKLISDIPGATRGYLRIASLLREKRQAGEALQVLRAAIQQDPKAATPREVLAELCLEMGRWEEAIQQSRTLLALTPRSLFARDVLSAAYLQRGLLDQALRVTEEMISLDPTDPTNHFKRGVLLQQKGRLGGAVRAFLRVLEMDPDSEAADESRAALEMLDCCQLRQIVTLAVEDIPFRLRLRHNCADAVTARGFLLSERGLAALTQMRFDDLPEPPPGWRQYHYN